MTATKRSRGLKQVRPCECCGRTMVVRSADVKRGWGRFCGKSCKAKKQAQETGYSGPASPMDIHPFSEDAFNE